MEEAEDANDAAEPVELVECVNRNRVPPQGSGTMVEASSAQDFPTCQSAVFAVCMVYVLKVDSENVCV